MNASRFRGVEVTGATAAEVTTAIVDAATSHRTYRVSFVNPHSFNLMRDGDASGLRDDLEQLDLVLADGIGVTWAVRVLIGERLPRLSFDLLAPELMTALADRGSPVYLIGGKPGVAEAAGRAIERRWPGIRIAGTRDGYMRANEVPALAEVLTNCDAPVVLIGAGAPLQERLALELSALAGGRVYCTCGGYFDQVTRASDYYPAWAYPLRLNWVVRLWREPRRLWRRYLIGNPTFVVDSLAWRARHRRSGSES